MISAKIFGQNSRIKCWTKHKVLPNQAVFTKLNLPQNVLIYEHYKYLECSRGIFKIWSHLIDLPKFCQFQCLGGKISFERFAPSKTVDIMKLCIFQ